MANQRGVSPPSGGERCARDPVTGCLLHQGRKDRNGYGLLPNGRLAHVDAWEAEHGPVPEKLVLDHLCRRRHCRTVAHLEPVTRSENELRKAYAYRLRIRRCPQGHDLYSKGVRTVEGGKVCGVCSGVRKA